VDKTQDFQQEEATKKEKRKQLFREKQKKKKTTAYYCFKHMQYKYVRCCEQCLQIVEETHDDMVAK
jgi:ribosomal protein L22